MDTNEMMPPAMKAEFEAAFRAKFGIGSDEIIAAGDDLAAAMMGAAAWAWQTSRGSVVVELPSVEENGTLTRGVVIGVLGAVRSSIEAQGLKCEVKP